MKLSYSTLFIERALGIDRERLRVWTRKGFISPTYPASGQGTRAGFTLNDLYVVAIFDRLLKLGMKRENAAQILKGFSGVKEELLQHADYFMFKAVIVDGELAIDTKIFAGEPNHHSARAFFYPDRIIVEGVDDDLPAAANETWSEVHIINLVNLKVEINKAIEEDEK